MIYAIMIVSALLTILFSYITSDWYWIIIIPALSGIFMKTYRQCAVNGVVTALIGWGLPAAYMYLTSAHIIGNKVAEIFKLGSGWMMIIAATVIAIIFAITGSSTGFYMGKYLKEEFAKRKAK
ncbi:MAG: hypothetical protein SCALA702_23760 [Melioribacteraceae bacterium]|nr:MAG: hypothetical protein SCALA702_23760 [Melioribacteraceae bacterium]